MQPFQPPFDTSPLEGIGGCISSRSEDFAVDEVQLYPWSGEGDHLMVRFRKSGMNTQFAVKALARAAEVDPRDIGVAGQKDRWAVTTQWVSLPRRSRPQSEWLLPEGMEVLETAFHHNKLRTGHLSANRFRIVLVGVEDTPENRVREAALTERLRGQGVANYFGPQRFGRGGDNLGQALAWVLADRRRRGRVDRFVARLLPSVVQSEHFNRFLALRLAAGRDRLVAGEVVRLEGTNRLFAVEDPAAELPRLASHDIWLTGPMWGAKMRRAEQEAAAMELSAAAELGLDEQGLAKLAEEVDGTRRDLITPLPDLRTEWIGADDSGRGAPIVVLHFALPSGGYATQVAREYCRRSWDTLRPVERSDEPDDAGDLA